MSIVACRLYLLPLIGAGVMLSSCGSSGIPAQATVMTIDHECTIIETTRERVPDPRKKGVKLDASSSKTTRGECKQVDEWQDVRRKRTKRVDGTAAVHVTYQAPQDGSYQNGTLNYTGADDEFYRLKAGDTIDILVAEDDPTVIRKG